MIVLVDIASVNTIHQNDILIYFVHKNVKMSTNNSDLLTRIDTNIEYIYDNFEKIMESGDLITQMMNRLSMYAISLWTLIAESHYESQFAYVNRKIKETKTFLSKKASKIEDRNITDKLAEMIAKDESVEEIMLEIEKQSEYMSLDLKLKSINNLIYSLGKRVDYLRSEKDNSNK